MTPTAIQCIRIKDAYEVGVVTEFPVGEHTWKLWKTGRNDGRLLIDGAVGVVVKRVIDTKNNGLRLDCSEGLVLFLSPSKEAKP